MDKTDLKYGCMKGQWVQQIGINIFMPIIYKFTHTPTGKFYIGAKRNDSDYHNDYRSSSKVVSSMIKLAPHEWEREILKSFPADFAFEEVVNQEQLMIKESIELYGWEKLWNKHCRIGDGKLWSPASLAKNKKTCQTEEYRKKQSEITRKHWQNIEKNKTRLEHIRNLGKSSRGSNSYNYKGPILATSLEGKKNLILRGEIDIKSKGFNSGHVSSCVNGKLKHHKGYTFKLITENMASEIEKNNGTN